MFNRRQFLGSLGAGSIAALQPMAGNAATPRVVVVGGGMAGATVAKYLRHWSGKTIDVTLVVPSTTYVSNIMSNLVITGQISASTLNFSYSALTSRYGVKIVTGTVTAIAGYGGSATGTVTVVNGTKTTVLTSERVVLAPGIQMDAIPTTGSPDVAAPVLHAWQAGPQTTALQTLLTGIPNGGTFVMTIPAKPYRCPPGPYERACVIADWLQRNRPGARILVLDANPAIVAEPVGFGNAFTNYHMAGVLEYWPSTTVLSAGTAAVAGSNQTLTVNVSDGIPRPLRNGSTVGVQTVSGQVVNVIPPHRAPSIVSGSGLVPLGSRFAPVDSLSFESTLRQRVHVIGDAADTTLPKAGHVGNQGAKICANAIINAFRSLPADPAPTANSACFSPVSSTLASWLTAVYQYDANPASASYRKYVIWDGVLNQPATGATEAAAPSTGNFSKMNTWFKVLMSDSYA